MFKRNASPRLINKLNNEPLFKNLENDCLKQNVFLAVRSELIDFYYKGGRLFEFNYSAGFKTHIKYAAVIDSIVDYLTQQQLQQVPIVPDFSKNYIRIKENCSRYSGIEAIGVSEVYHKHSYLNHNDNIVVLDIEISFSMTKTTGKRSKSDRIDMVVFNKNENKLYFIEAKHFSNSEIWSRTTPKVINQIRNYEKQITLHKRHIISQYKNYIDAINLIFNCQIPDPTEVDEKVILLIFGFDSNQQKKLTDLILPDIKKYLIGNPGSINMNTLISKARID